MVVLGTTGRLLLGCNVYISAGACQRHIPILLNLLKGTQERCSSVTTTVSSCRSADNDSNGVCVVVHAFADVVYNRSSIHLAATSEDLMTTVVTDLVQNARRELMLLQSAQAEESNQNTEEIVAHPSVGLVDHVSVMPLLSEEKEEFLNPSKNDNSNPDEEYIPMTPWGRTARTIGNNMVDQKINILFYGDADPHQTPLAEVRRHKTNFFQSGGLEKAGSEDNQHVVQETATVGAPSNFVENFNIRLSAECDKKTAQSLTRAVRERNGGCPGVEALTLPYSNGRHEVACNLLQPNAALGSVQNIQKKIDEWVSEAPEQRKDLVETAYRVGTTSDQCLEVLEIAASNETLDKHNNLVWEQLKGYLTP